METCPKCGFMKFIDFLKYRSSSSKWYFLLFLLSLTLMMADFRKYRAGDDKDRKASIIKRDNIKRLIVSIGCVLILWIADNFDLLMRFPTIATISLAFLGYYSISRCNEVFYAFIKDATGHLKPGYPGSGLKYYERIHLAMISYLELILDFGILFFVLSFIFNVFHCNICILQAIYFSGVTITTLGYGDISPHAIGAQLLSVYEVITGFSLIIVSFTVYVSRSVSEKEFNHNLPNSKES